MGGEVPGELVVDGRLEPAAIALDVNDGVASDLGRPAPAGVMVVRPSSSAVSGPRKRSAFISMAILLPGLSANAVASWSWMARGLRSARPSSSTTRASSAKVAAAAAASPALKAFA